MAKENLFYFDIDENVKEIKCPECGKYSKTEHWKDVDTYCETCGDHAGLKCPECEEIYDHVWDDDKLIDFKY